MSKKGRKSGGSAEALLYLRYAADVNRQRCLFWSVLLSCHALVILRAFGDQHFDISSQ